jgi:RNA methyltransferase, TrmH family
MITSVSNAKVKLVCSLARRRARYTARQFVVEGVRGVQEAQGAGITPALVFYTAAAADAPHTAALLERMRATTSDVFEVSDAVMQAMSETDTPSGVLAVLPFPDLPLVHPEFLLVLDNVRDPGNLGTILRSAWATGVEAVWLAPGTVDPFNGKVVRAAMGAHFRVPLRAMTSWDAIAGALSGWSRIYLADAAGDVDYGQADWTRPVALIVGGEAEGATPAARALATARVRIPMQGGVESLNAAMAATVLLFKAHGSGGRAVV